MDIGTELVVCNQCGSVDYRIIARGTDREYYTSTDEFTFVQCTHCGLIYLNPRPIRAELGRIYPANYHSYILDDAVGSKGSFITKMRQKAGANRFRPIMAHLREFEEIQLLDVGCGNGWMMLLFESLDPKRIKPFGVEISEAVCESARRLGHSVYCGRFEDVNLDRKFDVINLTHVIEHVSDPRFVVGKAFNALNPGGLLVLETPNIGAVEWPLFKERNWGAYHIPRHWYLYDRQTISRLGETEGFRMVDWYCHPGPTHWIWTMHNLFSDKAGWLARMGNAVFDPVRLFRGGLISTIAMTAFFLLDMLLLGFGKETSVMTAVFKKTS